MYGLILALLALVLAAPVYAQVHVDIGIHLPAPPKLIVVPTVPTVKYVPAPAAAANLFFYNGQYWAFTASGGWHVSVGFNGPWVVVGPQFVPRPVLLVPVEYYHVPPGHWKKWQRKHAPHWDEDWGPEWAQKRGWKHGDRDDDDHPGKGGKGHGKGHAKGHGKGR